MAACCAIRGNDEGCEELGRDVRRAGKVHACCECSEAIAKGDHHEAYTLKFDGTVSTYRTCLLCVEIRDHFACGNGWTFGEVWEQLAENLFPDMTAGGPCFKGLSPRARAELIDACLAWRLDVDEIDNPRVARPPSATPVVPYVRACSHLAIEIGGRVRISAMASGDRRPQQHEQHEICADCGVFRPLDRNGHSIGEWIEPKHRIAMDG